MSMRTILLISGNEKGFLETSIYNALEENGIKVSNALFTDLGLEEQIADASIVLLIAGNAVDTTSPLVNGLKQKCYDMRKYVAIYGVENDIEQLKRIFPESMIMAQFVRPVETDELVKELDILVDKADDMNRQKTILVVDDDGQMLRTIMGWLEDRYKVLLANSAASAFAAIEKMEPDLILLDYEMPICSGAQFLEMLRAEDKTKEIPVIFLTSRGDADIVKSVLELKPEGYILKTSPQQMIRDTIDQFFTY